MPAKPLPDVITLSAPDGKGPRFLSATIMPSRGMLLLQARVRLADGSVFKLLATPPPGEIAKRFGGKADFAGSASFGMGGAILLPFANRITGKTIKKSREVETDILGRKVRLPMNWGGKAKGAAQYAMHGLMLDKPFEVVSQDEHHVRGLLHAGDFGGRWVSATDVSVEYRLSTTSLMLKVEATNAGGELLPIGIGWHPWFNLPSGNRAQARLRVASEERTPVNDYDEVLPTGEVLAVAGTPYDFSAGKALGDLHLDDCFVRPTGHPLAELVDPVARFGLRIDADAPPVQAVQVYAPSDRPVVVVEPQYNWADPFNPVWKGTDTGLVTLRPGEATTYLARVDLFTP